MNENIRIIKEEIIRVLSEESRTIDLSDIGNEIGIAIGPFITTDMGFEKDDFIAGVMHGISLIDGTHGCPHKWESDTYETLCIYCGAKK